MVEWLAGNRISGTSAERATGTGFPVTGISGGWKEVARTTLGSTTKPITVSSIPDKRYYMFMIDMQKSGNATSQIRFGSGSTDTGTNYADRCSYDGAADGTRVSVSSIEIATANAGVSDFMVGYISNLSTKEKYVQIHWAYNGSAGAGTSPSRAEKVGKWSNLSNPLDILELYNSQSGNYLSGSEVVVLGCDEDDTHTDNFWEELASVDLSGGTSTSLSTGTFTAKKYLWVQIFSKKASAGGIQPSLKVGTGGTIATGSPYAFRWSNDGVADPTPSVNLAMCPIAWLGANVHFSNTFIINNSGNEKLFINHSVANVTAGAGTAPQRVESVGKFANTSGQINIIDLYDWDSASLGTETIMKVWGHD